jgi:pyridoxal/pyridoxine/pyridoxamine kinase
VSDLPSALAASAALRRQGPRIVVATGLPLRDRPETLGVLADAGDEAWLVTTPRRPVALGGTGDTFSALFLGHYLRSRKPARRPRTERPRRRRRSRRRPVPRQTRRRCSSPSSRRAAEPAR